MSGSTNNRPCNDNCSNHQLDSYVSGQFADLIDVPEGAVTVMLGNAAFALGVLHAGFRAAEGYPGTPSTEVVDTLLGVRDRIDAAWSVNEAVAVGVALGRSLAGDDVVVTMKTPGLFQAADVVSSAAFYDVGPGAMVIYVATDYEPSSTQNIIDARYFLSSCGIPVLEPTNHQEQYEIPMRAAALSRKFRTPVVVLTSGVLAHSEGLVRIGTRRKPPEADAVAPRTTVLLPAMARERYDKGVTEILPAIGELLSVGENRIREGREAWGIVSVGASSLAVREALATLDASPRLLEMTGVFPTPVSAIQRFASDCAAPIVVFEEGGRFVEEQIRLQGIDVVGKETTPTTTFWTPERVLTHLASLDLISSGSVKSAALPLEAPNRPPSICPGCPYRGITLALKGLKKKGRLTTVFGDIGCSTLMLFLGALDLNLCMGASESIRQGYVTGRPEAAAKTLSLIGDSCECHSGMDASRNAVFRNIPGVKVILDNRLVAMTGGQVTPTTNGGIDLAQALKGEGIDAVDVDAFDLKGIDLALKNALDAAADGRFNAIVLRGECLQARPPASKKPTLEIDYDKCTKCNRCAICPGISVDDDGTPHYTMLCRNCGGNENICMQRCHKNAIVKHAPASKERKDVTPVFDENRDAGTPNPVPLTLPESIRLAVRGIGGQGNLFLGKVLANVFLSEVRPGRSIVKGETHGMAQLGGPVVSTFAFGDVHSPIFAPGTADVLIGMEASEILRPGFLALLKPHGMLVCNKFSAIPEGAADQYPSYDAIAHLLRDYHIVEVDAFAMAKAAGDGSGATANVAVIAVLSTLPPFSCLPPGRWLAALDAVSKTRAIADRNHATFDYSRRFNPFSI